MIKYWLPESFQTAGIKYHQGDGLEGLFVQLVLLLRTQRVAEDRVLGAAFIRAAIPTKIASSSRSKYFPEPLLSNTITQHFIVNMREVQPFPTCGKSHAPLWWHSVIAFGSYLLLLRHAGRAPVISSPHAWRQGKRQTSACSYQKPNWWAFWSWSWISYFWEPWRNVPISSSDCNILLE